MKYLLFILLFFYSCSYSQITITRVTASGQHNCSGSGLVGVQHNNIPLTNGKLYFAVVMADSTGNYGNNIGGTSFTWDTVVQIQSHTRRISIYRCLPTSSTTTDDPLANWSFGNFPNNIDFYIYEITGIPLGLNGANAISRIVIDSASSGTDPTINAGNIRGGSAIFAAFINNKDPFGGSAESGWTNSFDNGCTTFPSAVYIDGTNVTYRENAGDNTVTLTASSSDWIGVAIVIGGNRRIIIN